MNTNSSALRPTLNPQPARPGPVPLDLAQLRHVAGGLKTSGAKSSELLAPRGGWL